MQIMEKQLAFVLRHFGEDRFNPEKGWRRFAARAGLSGIRRRPSLGWALGVAASVALLVSAGLWLERRFRWTEFRAGDVAQTYVLRDASRVTLAPGAVLRCQEHRAPRTVYQTGKILYEVVHKEKDPFEVISEGGYVRVLGTVFQLDADKGEAACLSGKVLFSPSRGQEGLLLKGGERATMGDKEPSASLNPSVWATGRFVYDHTPLSLVAEDLSAYYGVPLSVPAGEGGRLLTATLEAEPLPELLGLIEAALGVRMEQGGRR